MIPLSSNEELAVRIRDGETNLYGELWENVKRLFFLKATAYYNRHKEKCRACGVELDDIYQSCFLALHEAVKAYSVDSGYQFTSYLSYSFKNAVDALMNGTHRRKYGDPLNLAYSLDMPLSDESETTQADLMPDEAAANSFDDAELRIYTQELHEALEKAMARSCTEKEITVLRRIYWDGETLQTVADALGSSVSYIGQMKSHAFRQIRKRGRSILEPYGDFIRRQAYHGTSLNAFRTNGESSVERTVELWEENRDKRLTSLVYDLVAAGDREDDLELSMNDNFAPVW